MALVTTAIKKIVGISIENYRAYFGNYDVITLDRGQNLLIYGENGSGKSSMFKALNEFFLSSNQVNLPFAQNKYASHANSEIRVKFSDYDFATKSLINGSEQEFSFSTKGSTNNVAYIKTTALTKGFLDYTDLLKVYFHQDSQPNLFELVVLSLLGDHIPQAQATASFKTKWHSLQRDLFDLPYTRRDRVHQRALRELATFEIQLRATLDAVFIELNRMLAQYFPDTEISLGYDLKQMNFYYGNARWEWDVPQDLRLKVQKNGQNLGNNYGDFLNEARLSAFAVCLYLASLKLNPSQLECKILYLDDVFIGLDAGNRIPILKILNSEFNGYQVFISTYDRHWYELAKNYFTAHDGENWRTLELYVGKNTDQGTTFDVPIVVKGSTYFSRAVQYLNHRVTPDYPAAANYFRKGIEELLQKYIPKWELVDSNMAQLPEYKLTAIIKKSKAFLQKIKADCSHIDTIIGLLHSLVHPLSHHEISSPIYRNELKTIESSFVALKLVLQRLDANNNYKCLKEPGKRIQLSMDVPGVSQHQIFYRLSLLEGLVISKNGLTLSDCRCHAVEGVSVIDGVSARTSLPKKNLAFHYSSLLDAFDKIYAHNLGLHPSIVKPANYLDAIAVFDDVSNSWQPISNIIVQW